MNKLLYLAVALLFVSGCGIMNDAGQIQIPMLITALASAVLILIFTKERNIWETEK